MAGVRLEQPGPGGLQPAHDGGVEPAAQLVAEGRVPVAGRADRPGLELEPLHALRRDRAEPPLVRRGQPGQAEHVAPAERPDDQPTLTGDRGVERDLAGVDEPEPVGGGALLEYALPRWHHDMLAQHAQPGQMLIGQPAQERLRPQNRLLLRGHAEPPLAAPPRPATGDLPTRAPLRTGRPPTPTRGSQAPRLPARPPPHRSHTTHTPHQKR